MAFIKGRGALIGTRLAVGIFEAGFYPTSVAFLSTFYRRFDLAVRVALFYGQYAIAGAFSGAMGELMPSLSLRHSSRPEVVVGMLTERHSIRYLSDQEHISDKLAMALHHRRCYDMLLRNRFLDLAPGRSRLCMVLDED